MLLAMMHAAVSEGWEWRYFKPIASAALERARCRTDVYFPASAGVGVKLRNMERDKLEAKVLMAEDGDVGLWHKHYLPYDVNRVQDITDNDISMLSSGLLVYCRKQKRPTQTGEHCVCTFDVILRGEALPCLTESFESVSVEVGDPDAIRRHLPTLPDEAFVASFPQVVCDLARRAQSSK